MGLIPAEKKTKAGQFFLWIFSALFWFIAGCCWFDDSYPWYQRVAGVVGVVILVCIFIIVGYWMVYKQGGIR